MGTTIIRYTVGSGCWSSATVTVYPLAPILGPSSVCAGSQISLTNIVGGGTWVSSNPAVAGIDTFSGIVTGYVTGITYIGYSLPTGCATTFFLNIIPPLPPIAGSLQICSNSESILSNGVTGGTWSTSNEYVVEVNPATGMASGHFPDTATVFYTKGGCLVSAQVTINPLPDPIVSFNWGTRTFSTPPIFAAYQWYDSTATGVIPGATNATLTVANKHNDYFVRVTDFNGCSKASDWYRFPLATPDLTAVSVVRIYPNPAVATIHIEAPGTVSASISGIEGKAVLEVKNAKDVDISKLANGIYFITVYDEEGRQLTVQKLVKQ